MERVEATAVKAAIESTCDKHHQRMMCSGHSEKDAAFMVARQLTRLETVWRKNNEILHFVKSLKDGYLYDDANAQ